jgi:lysophospholipase L1-like esterase
VRNRALANAALLAASLAAALLGGELLFRFAFPTPRPRSPTPVGRTCGSCAPLYELDPSRPGISPQATRDDAVAIPKPPGVVRILVLGDSIAYGSQVRRADAFPDRLEAALDDRARRVEVVNAGVPGYGPWNEERWFAERGRAFEPDLVLVAVCLNDVVDPLPHWARGIPVIAEVPDAAIPDPEYHRRKIAPLVRWRSAKVWLSERSALGARLATSLLARIEPWLPFAAGPPPRREAGGRAWPAHLTLEDDLPIDVWLDRDTPEWRWLARTWDALAAEVAAAGARLALGLFPLSYQMDPAYPFAPQDVFLALCSERGLACLDLLPPMRAAAREGTPLWIDDWHPSPRGHAVAAAAIARFLADADLLPGPARRPRSGAGWNEAGAGRPSAAGEKDAPGAVDARSHSI